MLKNSFFFRILFFTYIQYINFIHIAASNTASEVGEI